MCSIDFLIAFYSLHSALCLFISERLYAHLVKTLTVSDVDYKYFDITSLDPSYGMFL